MYVVERFAAFAEASRRAPIAPEVLHHAKRAVIDWYAALFPGAVVPPATLLEQSARRGARPRRRAPRPRPAGDRRAAALINGTAAHTVEVDDIYRDGIYHPGAPTIAAALALAQARRASGEAFLRAVDRRLRDLHAHRRRDGPRALQVLAQHRHDRLLRRRGGRRRAARPGREALRARACDGRDLRRRAAAGVPHGLDVQAAARRARRRGRRDRRARGAAKASPARSTCIEGEAGFGRAMGDDPDWEQGARHARPRLPHHAHDLQEPRLLRPHLRRDRRRARAAEAAGRGRARHRARARRHLPRRRSRWRTTRSRARRPRRASR